MTIRRQNSGRYGSRRAAFLPANGLASGTLQSSLATAVVDDPLDAGRELLVSVNRKVDLLEMERSHKRISEAAYRVGREIQALFETGTSVASGSLWREGDRVDAAEARDRRMVQALDTAHRVLRETDRLEREIGEVGTAFLREMLVGSVSFADFAARTTAATRRDVDRVASRFREMLEEIVRHRAARGRAA